jgi:hypothetical protein
VGKKHPTSYEVMKMKAVNHKPMIRPEGTLALQGGEEVRNFTVFYWMNFFLRNYECFNLGLIYSKPSPRKLQF